MRYRMIAGFFLFTTISVAFPATDAFAWPATWTPVYRGANYYTDYAYPSGTSDIVNTPPQPAVDIVGGIDSSGKGPFPSLYWYQDGTNIMFGMRLDADPTSHTQAVWQILLSKSGGSQIDWVLQLDEKSHNAVEMVAATGGPADWKSITLTGTHYAAPNLVDYHMHGPVTDGSNFNSTADGFLGIAYPLSSFQTHFGTGPIYAAAGTSDTDLSLKKDIPDFAGWSNALTPVPEPSTRMGLTGLGLMGAGWALHRHFKKRLATSFPTSR